MCIRILNCDKNISFTLLLDDIIPGKCADAIVSIVLTSEQASGNDIVAVSVFDFAVTSILL